MANLSSLFGNNAFKPAEVEEVEGGFDPVPKGQYTVQVTESEVMPNNLGTGTNLTLKLVIQDGKFKNRVIFDNLCVVHKNATAQAIAQSKLKQICESVGIKALKDSSQLHDKNISVFIVVAKDDYKTEKQGVDVFRNNIRSYASLKVTETLEDNEEAIADDDIPF